jgi:signal transduction histidine kinase
MHAAAVAVPPPPANGAERRRNNALSLRYVLDTPPEADYDGLALLAAQVCDAPIALISFLDGERQWFKAAFGIDLRESSRDEGFCAHVLLRPDELLVVPDATRDARFAGSPLVTGEAGIRFYAGAAVFITPHAPPVGTICILDRRPRTLTPSQQAALRALSVQVGNLLDLRLHRIRQDEAARQFAEAQEVARIGSWEYELATGRITWTPEMFRLLGFDPAAGEPDYAGLMRRYHPDDVPMHDAYVRRAARDGESYQFDIRAVSEDGTIRWMHSRGRGGVDAAGNVVRLHGTVMDITERKEAEERQRALADELGRYNTALEEFVFIASHDLKEPLRKIQTFGDMLRRKAGGVVSDEARGYLDRMTGAAERMQALIDGLLAYSRVLGHGADRRATDLNRVAGEVLCDLEARIAETDGRVDIGPLPTAAAVDPLLLRQLLQNLIANALKFHRPGEPPSVSVRASRGGGALVLTVSDDGIGFDPSDAERIFTAFERLQGGRTYEGSGIGLSICRKIAEAHGGTIRAESHPGEGATFVVTLPA